MANETKSGGAAASGKPNPSRAMMITPPTQLQKKPSPITATDTASKKKQKTTNKLLYSLSRISYTFDAIGMMFPIGASKYFDSMLEAAGAKKIQGRRIVGLMSVASVFALIGTYFAAKFVVTSTIIAVLAAPLGVALCWGVLIALISLKIDARAKEIEEYLPDFLQLCSANVKAGMPIDQSLWFAARPEFGLISKEIDGVARKTFGGEPFQKALLELGGRFRSKTFQRSVRLINEGIDSGGEMGNLLERTSWDIRNMAIMQKEVSGSVMMYIIFILFAAGFGAPFLFALSNQLLVTNYYVMGQVGGNTKVDESLMSQAKVPMVMSSGEPGISLSDFYKFAIMSIIITGIISSLMIATIKSGNSKDGLKYIPAFVGAGLCVFLFTNYVMGLLLKGILKT